MYDYAEQEFTYVTAGWGEWSSYLGGDWPEDPQKKKLIDSYYDSFRKAAYVYAGVGILLVGPPLVIAIIRQSNEGVEPFSLIVYLIATIFIVIGIAHLVVLMKRAEEKKDRTLGGWKRRREQLLDQHLADLGLI